MRQHIGNRIRAWVASGVLGLACGRAGAELIYITDGTNLSRIDSVAPAVVTPVGAGLGLPGGETLLGIDVRPNGQGLYGVSSAGKVYSINGATGGATAVSGTGAFAPTGTKFGVDFNPTADLIRITSNAAQNLRLNPVTGVRADTLPNDAPLSGSNVAEVAYSNNFPGAASTTLYAIDSTNDTLVTIGSVGGGTGANSPNGGVLNLVGSLGVDTSSAVGFDVSGAAGNTAYASLFTTISGVTLDRLYTINLTTGAATLVGTIGTGTTQYTGLATAAAPEPTGLLPLTGAAIGFFARRRRK